MRGDDALHSPHPEMLRISDLSRIAGEVTLTALDYRPSRPNAVDAPNAAAAHRRRRA